jgi:hypothetical protein
MRLKTFLSLPLLWALSGCSLNADLDADAVEQYFRASSPDNVDDMACRDCYGKRIGPALEKRFPALLEKARRFADRADFPPAETRGLIRIALLEKAAGAEDGQTAAELLKPAIADFLAMDSLLLSGLSPAPDRAAVEKAVPALAARLTLLCLGQVEINRSRSESEAERYRADLKMMFLFLPEKTSTVANITGLLYAQADRNVNDINVEEISNLLKGAYPGMF